MRHHITPIIGNWYQDREHQQSFEVVATDEYERNVEIQYFDGGIGELDLDVWYELDLRSIAPPEDWSGAFEVSHEDLDYLEETIHPDNHSNPLNEIEPDE